MLFHIDVMYDGDDGEIKLTTIEAPDFLKCIHQTEKLIKRQKKMNPQIGSCRWITEEDIVDIKFKVLSTINERRNNNAR